MQTSNSHALKLYIRTSLDKDFLVRNHGKEIGWLGTSWTIDEIFWWNILTKLLMKYWGNYWSNILRKLLIKHFDETIVQTFWWNYWSNIFTKLLMKYFGETIDETFWWNILRKLWTKYFDETIDETFSQVEGSRIMHWIPCTSPTIIPMYSTWMGLDRHKGPVRRSHMWKEQEFPIRLPSHLH